MGVWDTVDAYAIPSDALAKLLDKLVQHGSDPLELIIHPHLLTYHPEHRDLLRDFAVHVARVRRNEHLRKGSGAHLH